MMAGLILQAVVDLLQVMQMLGAVLIDEDGI
jgi:hypothetical protein